jgi:hypothetical protein
MRPTPQTHTLSGCVPHGGGAARQLRGSQRLLAWLCLLPCQTQCATRLHTTPSNMCCVSCPRGCQCCRLQLSNSDNQRLLAWPPLKAVSAAGTHCCQAALHGEDACAQHNSTSRHNNRQHVSLQRLFGKELLTTGSHTYTANTNQHAYRYHTYMLHTDLGDCYHHCCCWPAVLLLHLVLSIMQRCPAHTASLLQPIPPSDAPLNSHASFHQA